MLFKQWLLLQIYPRQYRDELGAEMIGVFLQRLAEQRAGWRKFAFLVEEVSAMLYEGLRIRIVEWEGWPVFGGLTLATLLHVGMYWQTAEILAGIHAAARAQGWHRGTEAADPEMQGMAMTWGATLCFLFLLVNLLVMSRRLRKQVE